jgi:hypothetical protein
MLRSHWLRSFVLAVLFGGFAVNAYSSMLHYSMMAASEQTAHSAHHAHGGMAEQDSSDTDHHH